MVNFHSITLLERKFIFHFYFKVFFKKILQKLYLDCHLSRKYTWSMHAIILILHTQQNTNKKD